jgi:hypothetical protein
MGTGLPCWYVQQFRMHWWCSPTLIHSRIRRFIHWFIRRFIHSFIHSFTRCYTRTHTFSLPTLHPSNLQRKWPWHWKKFSSACRLIFVDKFGCKRLLVQKTLTSALLRTEIPIRHSIRHSDDHTLSTSITQHLYMCEALHSLLDENAVESPCPRINPWHDKTRALPLSSIS